MKPFLPEEVLNTVTLLLGQEHVSREGYRCGRCQKVQSFDTARTRARVYCRGDVLILDSALCAECRRLVSEKWNAP